MLGIIACIYSGDICKLAAFRIRRSCSARAAFCQRIRHRTIAQNLQEPILVGFRVYNLSAARRMRSYSGSSFIISIQPAKRHQWCGHDRATESMHEAHTPYHKCHYRQIESSVTSIKRSSTNLGPRNFLHFLHALNDFLSLHLAVALDGHALLEQRGLTVQREAQTQTKKE